MAAKFVIVHGSFGHPRENWFPWLAGELRRRGQLVWVPAFPTPKGQDLATWRAAFAEQVGRLEPDMILIGHSLGAAFLLRLLEDAAQPVAGAFLVSGFVGPVGHPVFDALNASFFETPFPWDRIRTRAPLRRVYHGDSDPFVPMEMARGLAGHLECPLTVIEKGGHLNALTGYVKFERLLADLGEVYPRLAAQGEGQRAADVTAAPTHSR
jgi:predicted alpha/beta hydrolase family esterase